MPYLGHADSMHNKVTDFKLEVTADLNRWRTFVAISELGSLTRAALFLDTNQSLLSRQINKLERVPGHSGVYCPFPGRRKRSQSKHSAEIAVSRPEGFGRDWTALRGRALRSTNRRTTLKRLYDSWV